MHRAKLLGRAGWHAVLWAVAQLWPRERKGVCLRVLFKDINLCKTRGKIWVTLPEMVSTASCTFVGRGRREIQWVLLMVPEPQPPHPRDPFHSVEASCNFPCSRTKESAGPHCFGVCLPFSVSFLPAPI